MNNTYLHSMEKHIKNRKSFSLNEKLKIIEAIESGKSQSTMCKTLNLNKSTVSNIWVNRSKIKNEWHKNAKKKKLRSSSRPEVDTMLLTWFQQQRANKIPVSGAMLQLQAEEFGKLSGGDFKCSSGWLDRFKKRHAIVFGKISGESGSVDKTITDQWLADIWPSLSNGYSPDNIFNADETGIFYKLTPDKTHKFRGEKCFGGKLSKERITVMLCANSSGSEKRKPLVIGKFQKPRCFKNTRTLPVDYTFNKKAWMTSSIFENYVKKWDLELNKEKRQILLLIDNCPAHPHIELNNIKLAFFPPRSTSVLQPMDQGIIWSLKQTYRKELLLKILEMQATDRNVSISILDAIIILHNSWTKVSTETIRNCFHRAGLIKNADSEVLNDSFDLEDNLPLSQLLKMDMFLHENIQFKDYVYVDKNVTTTEHPISNQTLVDEVMRECGEEVLSDSEDDETDMEVISTKEALTCVGKLQNFFQSQTDKKDFLDNLNKMHRFLLYQFMHNTSVQTKITDFLK